MPNWNDWEVFGRDGEPKYRTDREETARKIAQDERLDYAPRNKEADGRGGWKPWR